MNHNLLDVRIQADNKEQKTWKDVVFTIDETTDKRFVVKKENLLRGSESILDNPTEFNSLEAAMSFTKEHFCKVYAELNRNGWTAKAMATEATFLREAQTELQKNNQFPEMETLKTNVARPAMAKAKGLRM